LINSRHC